jgi:hypothetical protein
VLGEVPDLAHVAILIVAGVAAGFVNTLAGGGAVIAVPALMLLGLPGDVANATNRVAVVVQSLTGAIGFARGGKLDRAAAIEVVPVTVCGALAGAYVATILPNRIFEPLLIVTMIAIAVLLMLRPGTIAPTPGGTPKALRGQPWAILGLLAAGFWGGFMQAGVGIILLVIFGGLLRYDLIRGNAIKVAVVMIFSTVALIVFIIRAKIVWIPGLILTAGTVAGATIAVKFALSRSERAVRLVVAGAVIVLSIVMLLR